MGHEARQREIDERVQLVIRRLKGRRARVMSSTQMTDVMKQVWLKELGDILSREDSTKWNQRDAWERREREEQVRRIDEKRLVELVIDRLSGTTAAERRAQAITKGRYADIERAEVSFWKAQR